MTLYAAGYDGTGAFIRLYEVNWSSSGIFSITQARQTSLSFDPTAPGAIAIAGGAGPVSNLSRALAAIGGISSFIRPGERVLIKPNCAWDRSPEQAANSNPQLIGELARRCLTEAGAASVVVADNSCHDPARVFARSGIAGAAAGAGAQVVHQQRTGTVIADLGGSLLGPWQVLEPFAKADRVINVPVVKHHSLALATIGMKNWIGALVGQRRILHQHLEQVIAELATAFRPTLTVVDATRVLTGGGPTGGALNLVRPVDQVAVATDPVAAEAWGASLLGLGPNELPHLDLAARQGLGSTAWQTLAVVA
jgi:uncharacterized protein (DUF362 family)